MNYKEVEDMANSRDEMGSEIKSAKSIMIDRIVFVALSIGAVVMVFPLIYMVLSSFMTKNQILSADFSIIPDPWKFGKYSEVLAKPEFLRGLRNTLIVAAPVLVIGGFTSSLSAFSFSKLKFRGKNGIFLGLLATMMIPFAVVMIPQYVMFTKMGWTNSLLPLIIPGLFGNVSIIFFLRQNLTSVPDSIVEAAKLDGCGYFRMYYSIFLPLMKGALMTQLILWFMGIWNDYLAPTIFIQNEKWFTLQVVIRSFNSYLALVLLPALHYRVAGCIRSERLVNTRGCFHMIYEDSPVFKYGVIRGKNREERKQEK